MRLLTFVEFLELVVFATLAAVSYAAWRRRGGRSGAWLALTFGILAAVVPVSWFTPPTATGAAIELLRRAIVLLLALFPYCFYRFTWTFAAGSRRVETFARAMTVLLALATLVVPSVAAPAGPWPWWYVVYGIGFSVDWTVLSALSVARLWRAGRGQPTVARRRMRTLGIAAIVLNIALFIVVGSGGRGSADVTLAAQCAGLLSAILFLLGFAPPRALRTWWRRPEVLAFRKAEAALMGADTADRVASILLPHAAELVGAQAAMLVTKDGVVRARHGITDPAAAAAAARLPVPADPTADPLFLDGMVAIPVREGWLAVTTSPIAPFFGPEELSLLVTLAHLAGLALDRAKLFDRERASRRVLAEREFQLAEAQRTAQVGSYTWDLATDVVTWSDEMMRLLGVSGDVVDKGAAFASRIHPDDRARVLDAWRGAPQTSEPTSIEYRIVLPPDETRWIQGRVRPVLDDAGAVVRLIGTLQDITDRKRAEEEIAFQATHDALTRLPNRVLFMDRLSHALARRRRNPSGLAVLFLDLDRFKWLNDSLGHAAGDEVLVTVATRLRQALRPGDTLARFGGDEFVVLCEDVTSEAAALSLAQRLRTALEAPIEVGGEETTLTLSVGIAYASPTSAAETAEELVRDADAAMYRAKERGRDRHELFDITTRLIALARHETVNALRRGTERGEMVVHYQPQVDIASERVVGVEALVRWNHPERGLLTPGEFISLAEETGIIVPLGAKVFSAACEQAVAWERRGDLPAQLCLSVNLAARQLLSNDLCDVIQDVLRTSGLDSSQLCLEITESVLLEDTEASARALGDLKALGVRIAVDDFGTGFSALSYLKRFPVDVLKIDRSFVVGLGRSREDRAIVASVVDLAHAFGLTTVAEGVETPEQLGELRALGCELAQGFLWSPAMPPDAAARWMASQRQSAPPSTAAASPAPSASDWFDADDDGRPRARVLIVDDDPSVRRVLRMLLDDEEHFTVVGEAEDGREAIAVARQVHPDVVVLDLAMPGIGGLEALPLIQAVAPEAKVVVLSGLESATYGATALRQGAVAYFIKRGDLSELVTGLDVLLASSA